MSNLSLAQSAVKRLKTLRHPSILTFIDSVETDVKVQVATEHVSVLSQHLDYLDSDGLRGETRDNYIAWGLFQVKSTTTKAKSLLVKMDYSVITPGKSGQIPSRC